ncbi:hypothetical protein C9374_001308 [Naegleria lovaniensis]|uniref:Amine oxidase domain-containing protein n=1 Tax=Naegleria lovaniensis TaxID=51637 RepID=A0AA88KN74_NAELO|nr:uncharacterized protein C9374_001308 [Naegleria lovaniensis]KAG2387714.1 hypothetical protein C9374_001308 [Naegleria lovaniensis]
MSKSIAKTCYDVIITGGGHNGLVCAAYIKKTMPSLSVCVLERRHVTGGCAVSEQVHDGYKFSRASYLCSLFRGHIMDELDLRRRIKLIPRNPSSFTPTLNENEFLFLGSDGEMNKREISKFSKKDAQRFDAYEQQLQKVAQSVEYLLDCGPLDLGYDENASVKDLLFSDSFGILRNKENREKVKRLLDAARELGLGNTSSALDIFLSPAKKVLDHWFESDLLKATLSTDSIIGEYCSPTTPGSSYVLLHHVMGDIGYGKGIWAYVQGGMGAVTQALTEINKELGVDVYTNAQVKQFTVNSNTNRCTGVVLEDGTEITATKAVASNCDPHTTFRKLMNQQDLNSTYGEEFGRKVDNIDYSNATFKINLAVSSLPRFKCFSTPKESRKSNGSGKEHFGTIHFETSIDEIDQSYLQAKSSQLYSDNPVIEMTIPSSLDETLVKNKDHHVIQLFTQYAPYDLKEGHVWNEQLKRDYANKVYDKIESYAPGFKNSIIGEDLLSPLDLEQTFGMKKGNIFHGSIRLDQLWMNRPFRGFSNYRYFDKKHGVGLSNLYLCGAGVHPGGGVMGACGYNAAHALLRHLGYQ